MSSDRRFVISIRQISVLLLGLVIVLLALFNNAEVPVSLLFTVVNVPLSVMVLGGLLIGVLMGNAMALQRRKRREARQSDRRARKESQEQLLPAAEQVATDEVAVGGAEAEFAEPGEPEI